MPETLSLNGDHGNADSIQGVGTVPLNGITAESQHMAASEHAPEIVANISDHVEDNSSSVTVEDPTSNGDPATDKNNVTLESHIPGWRVKLYQLNRDGQWDDRGTGYICCKYVESISSVALCVVSETDNRELLQTKLLEDDTYQRQGENIITWSEPVGYDLALSFQENQGCYDIYSQIAEFQGRSFAQGRDRGVLTQGTEVNRGYNSSALPEPKWENLQIILEALISANSTPNMQHKDSIVQRIVFQEGDYIEKLFSIFQDCRDLDDQVSARQLCAILRAIVCLNDTSILEMLICDKFFVRMAEVFEFDPELKEKPNHRDFLENKVRFREVLPMEGVDTVGKIVQNFRVSFLKDTLLRPMMDDAMAATLNGVLYFNNNAIISALYKNSDYLKRVFQVFDKEDCLQNTRRDCLFFFKELFSMAKTLPQLNRDSFYRYIAEEAPIFDALSRVLSDESVSTEERAACMEILLHWLAHDPQILRMYVVNKGSHPPETPYTSNLGPGIGLGTPPLHPLNSKVDPSSVASSVGTCKSLLFWIIRRLTTDEDIGIIVQAAEVCRLFLETETVENSNDRDTFLSTFYSHYIHWLAIPFWEESRYGEPCSSPKREVMSNSTIAKTCRSHVCDLMTYCVRIHTYRMKYFVLRNNVASRVLRLVRYRDKFLQLAAIRFIRACVGVRDDFYNRYFVKNNLFAPIFSLLHENAARDNLIASAVLEFFEYIRAENIKVLIDYIVERFGPEFPLIGETSVLQGLVLRYDQNCDFSEGRERVLGGSNNTKAAQSRRRILEEDEDDAYFNESDEEDRSSIPTSAENTIDNDNISSNLAPLVPYDDDEDLVDFPARQRIAKSNNHKPKIVLASQSLKRSVSPPIEPIQDENESESDQEKRPRLF